MSDPQSEQHYDCMNRFIQLANSLKDEGMPVAVINWAMMTASAHYATYSVAGNTGGLNDSGIEKITDAYRQNLRQVQEVKKAQLQAEGAEIRQKDA
jgi:hypothetical protein